MEERIEILDKIHEKQDFNLRVVLFNVNGIKTLFNYYPWNNYNKNLNRLFQDLKADIVLLQELKISSDNISSLNLSNLDNYKSFITIPKIKKGYSGVGLFVRIPRKEEDDLIKYHLNVIKAEEGLTGVLKIKGTKVKELPDNIGGYPNIDESLADKIDSEGRSIVIELSCGLVVFSLYCPANSIRTEEGEQFKLDFFKILINRCENLVQVGKEIMIIGDINISLDLIDQAEGINERLKAKLIEFSNDGKTFEMKNLSECFKFKSQGSARTFLNRYVNPTLGNYEEIKFDSQFLYDTTRLYQERKMGIYTVWNTLKNSRQSNYGSRIDLILSTKKWSQLVTNANIWSFLMGSDHCPVFTDFKVPQVEILESPEPRKLDFEAFNFYKLVKHIDISTMFKPKKRQMIASVHNDKKDQLIYKSRKKNDQPSIRNFFSQSKENSTPVETSQSTDLDGDLLSYILSPQSEDSKSKSNLSIQSFFGEPPTCNHGLPCELKTSLNNLKTRGKKFWCCPKTNIGFNNEDRCDYFKWYKQ